jgi:hypothetical protein
MQTTIKIKLTKADNAKYFNVNVGDVVEVEFENFYLKGCVAQEIGNPHINAAKAQAVAARTHSFNAFKNGLQITDDSVHMTNGVAQAFTAQKAVNRNYANSHAGVDATKGEILFYQGKPLPACHFSDSNGGKTVDNKYAWENAKDDPWDAAAGVGRTGHGQGLSQRGAKYAAAMGVGYKEILAFYYEGTTVVGDYGAKKPEPEKEEKPLLDPKKVISVALAEVGYVEKNTTKHLDDKTADAGTKNYTKYSRDIAAWVPDYYNGGKQGASWCFPAGELVLTPNGYKDISELKIGDEVLDAAFNTTKITDVNVSVKPTLQIKSIGAEVITTHEHPILSQKVKRWPSGKEIAKGPVRFNAAGELKKGDLVCVATPVPSKNTMTEEQATAFGYYLGNGFKAMHNGKYTYGVCTALHNYDEVKKILIDSGLDILEEKKQYESRTCPQITIKNVPPWYENCGFYAYNKEIPFEVLCQSDRVLSRFLNGYLFADGHKKDNGDYRANTVSKKLAYGLGLVANRLNLRYSVNLQNRPKRASIFDKRTGKYREINQRPIYNMTFATSTLRNSSIVAYKCDEYTQSLVKRISESENMTVYNLTTETHTFICNNIIVHNCDVFVDWCFLKAFGNPVGRLMIYQPLRSCGAGCKYSRGYYKSKKHLFDTPQVGDQIFFWPKDRSDPDAVQHTGLVETFDTKKVYTVEGNSSNKVQRKSYALTDPTIAGYGRPNWNENSVPSVPVPDPVPTPAPVEDTTPTLKKNSQGNYVKILQTRLNVHGHPGRTSNLTVDGKFGPLTEACLRHLRLKRN